MKTAIYVRVATKEQTQEGSSIRAQEQKLKDYARIKDWSTCKTYMDEEIREIAEKARLSYTNDGSEA